MKIIYTACSLLFLASCSEDDKPADHAVTNATITDFRTEECYCCPSITLETSDGTYIVEEFPDFPLEESLLPIDVLVELKDYEGECPNKDVSADYLSY